MAIVKWDGVILREICDLVNYGYTASAKPEPIGPNFLRITDIVPNRIDWSSVPYCKINEKDIGRYRLEKGDIVIARTGATTGYAKRIRDNHRAVFASYLVRIRVNPKYDNRYVGFVIESDDYKQFIHQNIGGAAQPQANAQILTSFQIPLPPLRIQRKIADILSAYDELIEINQQRIALLERAGQEIYREWYVRLRFPGYERTKIVDGVPEGWEQLKVGNLLGRISSKKKIKKNDYLDTGLIPCVDQSREFIGGYTDDVDAMHESPLPVIVFGDHTRILKFIDFPFARGADGTQLLIPNRNDMSVAQFYFALEAIDLSNYFYARHFKFLKHQMMLVPPKALGDKFTVFASEIMAQIKGLREHNRELSRACDLLLPRLMSGKLTV